MSDNLLRPLKIISNINFKTKRQIITKEKGLEKKHLRLIYFFGILAAAYYYFIEPKTIGHDKRYLIFIFILPTLIGMIALGIYRRQFLINRFSTNKGFILWAFMIFFYLLQGVIFSYISFGQVGKIGWDYCNYKVTQQNSEECLKCPITRLWTGRRPSIDFKFAKRHESFRVSYQSIKQYKDINVNELKLNIKATKGLWNYYTVSEWNIEQK